MMLKRLFDLTVVIVTAPIIVPIVLILALLVRIKVGAPVFFRQRRPGQNGRVFEMFKFRTMTNAVGPDGNLFPDDQRITKFGQFLRTTSLDELPELWNVFRGDMSLVGPRPLLVEYLPLYTQTQMTRHDVKPGITGWAQVNGRNAISWDQKFEFDVWYVKNQSIWLDIKILGLTVKKVVVREGISGEGHVSAERFSGSSGC